MVYDQIEDSIDSDLHCVEIPLQLIIHRIGLRGLSTVHVLGKKEDLSYYEAWVAL